jgi:hypothetical protein
MYRGHRRPPQQIGHELFGNGRIFSTDGDRGPKPAPWSSRFDGSVARTDTNPIIGDGSIHTRFAERTVTSRLVTLTARGESPSVPPAWQGQFWARHAHIDRVRECCRSRRFGRRGGSGECGRLHIRAYEWWSGCVCPTRRRGVRGERKKFLVISSASPRELKSFVSVSTGHKPPGDCT